MEVNRLGVKFFAVDPASIRLSDIIPVFHSWIQKQSLDGHLLIDVHDYSHMHDGPGILLVAHEGNFNLDTHGLAYFRKTPTALPPDEHLAKILRTGLQACRLFEKDAAMKFKTDELLIIGNDRLSAPNDEATFRELQPILSAALEQTIGKFKLSHVSKDPKDRLTILATSPAL